MIFRDFEQKIVKIVNESGMSIDAIYFIMKNIMREIEEKYFEYCRIEDAAAAQKSNSEDEKSAVANKNEEGTN
jgi:hypothetical protein